MKLTELINAPYNRNYEPKPRYFNIGKEPVVGIECSLTNTLFDCLDQITICDFVFFGHDCMVLTGFHDYRQRNMNRKQSIKSAPVKIGRGAWIASGSIILPGVSIGHDAVVGAGSVVTKDVPPGELWAGNPARKIKEIDLI